MKYFNSFMLVIIISLFLSGCQENNRLEAENKKLRQQVSQLENELQDKETEIKDLDNKSTLLEHELKNDSKTLDETTPFHILEEDLLVVKDVISPSIITTKKIKEILGEPIKVEEYNEAHGSGKVIELIYDEATFTFNKNQGEENIKSVRILDSFIMTQRGIMVGSTKSEVVKAYGKKHDIYYENDKDITIGEKVGISFKLEDEIVNEIYIWFVYE